MDPINAWWSHSLPRSSSTKLLSYISLLNQAASSSPLSVPPAAILTYHREAIPVVAAMHSITDLTTILRKTRGAVPPPLAGASTTVIHDSLFLFGGRLVAQRRMLSDMYIFDIPSVTWEKLLPAPAEIEHVPQARYFHSADVWNGHIVIFGGMGYASGSTSSPPPPATTGITGPDGEPAEQQLLVLSDVRLFSIAQRRWLPASTIPTPQPDLVPRARFAHLSAITGDRLYIIGGQDLSNIWLDDIHVYDLRKQTWVGRTDYPKHCGTYRSVAVAAPLRVIEPGDGGVDERKGFGRADGRNITQAEQLKHLSHSVVPTVDDPNDIYLYSNYNFTDVKRELELIHPLPTSTSTEPFTITDHTSSFPLPPNTLPPGLRFPTGHILGQHLLLSGTYLAHTYQAFSLWALHLPTTTWTRIDAGGQLATGAWARGALWQNGAKFLIFGNKAGNLVEDYNRRLLSWHHVAYLDLEACGLYQPPRLALGLRESELGLAALEEEVMADFEIVCDDGRALRVSRRALEERWPWFREQRRLFLDRAARALEAKPEMIDPSYPVEAAGAAYSTEDVPSVQGLAFGGGAPLPRPDPRLTPRQLLLPEAYPIALALVQYLYTYALLTPLQHAPPVLSALLVLSSAYELPHLQALVRHAMHGQLTSGTAVGVYEVATICDCQSLQIRALKVVMSSSKNGVRGPRSRPDRHEPSTDGDPSSSPPPPPSNPDAPARPRGMSNARDLMSPPHLPEMNGTSHAPEPTETAVAPPVKKRWSGIPVSFDPDHPEEYWSRRQAAEAVVTPVKKRWSGVPVSFDPDHPEEYWRGRQSIAGLGIVAPPPAERGPALRRANSDASRGRPSSDASSTRSGRRASRAQSQRPMSMVSSAGSTNSSASAVTPTDWIPQPQTSLPLILEAASPPTSPVPPDEPPRKPLVKLDVSSWFGGDNGTSPATPSLSISSTAGSSPTQPTPKTPINPIPDPPRETPTLLSKAKFLAFNVSRAEREAVKARAKADKLELKAREEAAKLERDRLSRLGAESKRRAARQRKDEQEDERLRLQAVEKANISAIIRAAETKPSRTDDARSIARAAQALGGL